MRLPHDMEELMRQWLLLEPSRCDFSTEHDMWRVMAGNRQHVVCGAQIIDYPRIQIALQEAIGARGWSWCAGYKVTKIYDLEYYGRVMGHEVQAETPAEALLSAYLRALKANA